MPQACLRSFVGARRPASLERVIPSALFSVAMSGTEALETGRVTDADLPAPDVSIVVTLFNEAGSVDELYRRTVAALDPGRARSS